MMKSIKQLTLLLTLCLFILTSCNQKDNPIIDNETSCYDYMGRPLQALTYNEVAKMELHYDRTKRESIKKSRGGEEDTWLYHYNLKDLKAYIAYVEKLAKDKNIEVTGINIRAAAYPDDQSSGIKRDYQTLIFIPTTTINGKERVSFDPIYSKDKQPALFDSIVNNFKKELKTGNSKSLRSLSIPDMESSAANRVQQTPPEN